MMRTSESRHECPFECDVRTRMRRKARGLRKRDASPMQDAFAHCEGLLRAADKDRFLTTLFAPAERRDALFALYAFNLEIARVREVVREPVAGEIRLQWWSDVLGGASRGEVAAHPVAAALLATIARYRLPPEPFKALIDARRFDLYDEPMATLGDLEAYADGASASLIVLAAQILAAGGEPDIGALSHHAGLAHALAGLLAAFPVHAARGQLYIPLEILARHGADRQEAKSPPATPQLLAALAESRPPRPPSCPRFCRSRSRGRRSPAWCGAATIHSCRLRSRPGGGSGSSGAQRGSRGGSSARTQIGRAGCGDRRRCAPPGRARRRLRSATRSGRLGSWQRARGSRCAPRLKRRAAIARSPADARAIWGRSLPPSRSRGIRAGRTR